MKRLILLGCLLIPTVVLAADKYVSSSGHLILKTAASKNVNLQDKVYATQTGRLGLGTSAPEALFEIKQSTDAVTGGLLMTASGAGTNNGGMYVDGTSLYLREGGSNALQINNGEAYFMSGRVGIGTTSPAGTLEVSAPAGSANIMLTHAAAGRAWISIRNVTTSYGGFGQVGAWKGDGNTDIGISAEGSGGIQLFTNGLGTPRMTIASTGTVYMSSLSGGGTVTSSAGNLSVSSDASLKQELVKPLPSLKEVLELRPAAYQWKSGIETLGVENAPVEFGFMANEVAKIIPEAAPKGPNGLYGLHDRAIIVAAVNAIKEQQKVIELQKAWICAQTNAPEALCK